MSWRPYETLTVRQRVRMLALRMVRLERAQRRARAVGDTVRGEDVWLQREQVQIRRSYLLRQLWRQQQEVVHVGSGDD